MRFHCPDGKVGVTVVGIHNCIVLYPDGYKGTKASDRDGETFNSLAAWTEAENAGVVCLASAIYREGSDVGNTSGVAGHYWSSTPYDSYKAYDLNSTSRTYDLLASGVKNRSQGCSVRLVTDVK